MTTQENILDVTLYEPRQKHPTIFREFDALQPGQSLVLHNDHDPKPLYYQLLGERGDIFTWTYLEKGPQWWKVRIAKRKSEENNETLGQIAAKDLRKAEVFKKYGLDFCCGGKKTLREACAEKGLDAARVEEELQKTEEQPTERKTDFDSWKLDFLTDYIINNHHGYVRNSLPELRTYALKVSRVHGEHHPELKKIGQLVEEINDELLDHMESEERKIFPYIKLLVHVKDSMKTGELKQLQLKELVNSMETEHDSVGRAMEQIRELSAGYTIPSDACTSYKLLFKMLQEFENDLFTHIHLENNILFPKALELEDQLVDKS